ncbi:hypothetical protein [Ornithinibacillus scapharcae]|uniref:hypothetical protein n=1 Tax=Ornithinibacillus scapharcae TaxID=1147159 RepID=UPI000225AD5C|nr:hypothetical protein [Ornithinibacillus scapharcae]
MDVFIIIIIMSLVCSTISSTLVLKKQQHKPISMLAAFIINAVLLIGAFCFLTNLNDESKLFGAGTTYLYIMVFTIPVNTWINFLLLIVIQTKLTKQS